LNWNCSKAVNVPNITKSNVNICSHISNKSARFGTRLTADTRHLLFHDAYHIPCNVYKDPLSKKDVKSLVLVYLHKACKQAGFEIKAAGQQAQDWWWHASSP
jgi:hypothetical protein